MNLERVVLGLSVRSWLAVLTFVAAAGVVYGYVQQLLGRSSLLAWSGLAVGAAGILLGALPPKDVGNNQRSDRLIPGSEDLVENSGGTE